MDKTETSRKLELSWLGKPRHLRSDAGVKAHAPSERLGDPAFVRRAIFQAMAEGDYEAVIEIYRAHLGVLNRSRGARAMGVSRQYFHKMLRPSTEPSLPTFVKFMALLNKEQRASRESLIAA